MKIDSETLKVAIAQIDKGIEAAQREIERLRKARMNLLSGGSDNQDDSIQRTSSGRLPRGIPFRLTVEAFKRKKRLSVREIQEMFIGEKDVKLSDGSVRRALMRLEKEHKVTQQDDGTWVLVEPIGEDSDLPF